MKYGALKLLHWYQNWKIQFVVQHKVPLHPPVVLPKSWPSCWMWPHPLLTTSTVGSLDAGAATGDHKMQAWNQDLDACMCISSRNIYKLVMFRSSQRTLRTSVRQSLPGPSSCMIACLYMHIYTSDIDVTPFKNSGYGPDYKCTSMLQ